MILRWFIRICFMLPILLCLAGWLWSSTHETSIGYAYGEQAAYLGTGQGTLSIEWVVGMAQPGWELNNRPLNSLQFWPTKGTVDATWFLGICYCHRDVGTGGVYLRVIVIPYWFLLVVCGGVFAWVWRKTGKPKPGRAFPVEMAAGKQT